ncbi:MAG: methionyl-tRNA formyltransferase, partial [Myxococcaceae bacterium]
MGRPRIVFMGTPQFAVPSLLACLDVGDVVAVVTQPDKPKGRGQQLAAPPVKEAALERGLTVLQPPKLRTPPFSEDLKAYAPDVCVVTAYGKLLPKELLGTPKHGCVNVHASLLPRFRGAAPIQWAIAEGDAQTGVCLMVMDEGLDTGPVLARRTLPIASDDTSASLHDKLSALGGELIRADLPRFLSGALAPVAQSSEGMVHARLIVREDGEFDFQKPAIVLERRLRAFTPWPGAFTHLEGALLKVPKVALGKGKGTPGEVLSANAQGLEVACGEGSLVL